jgi:hypothetical protein
MWDTYEKWRLLPFGVEPSSLPKKWFCQMLDWPPDMNQCDISEYSTTQAVSGMYGTQLGQCEVDANKEQLLQPWMMRNVGCDAFGLEVQVMKKRKKMIPRRDPSAPRLSKTDYKFFYVEQ